MSTLYHERDAQRNTNVILGRGSIRDMKTIAELKTIAERLLWARQEAKLSQSEVAARARVQQGTIGNIESGNRTKPRDLVAIARAVNVLPEWLSDGKGPIRQRATASDTPAWPFGGISPDRWAALPDRIRGVAEQAAIRAILAAEADDVLLANANPERAASTLRSPRKQA